MLRFLKSPASARHTFLPALEVLPFEPESAFGFLDFLRSGLPGVDFLDCGFEMRPFSPSILPFDFFGFGFDLLVCFLLTELRSGQSFCSHPASIPAIHCQVVLLEESAMLSLGERGRNRRRKMRMLVL